MINFIKKQSIGAWFVLGGIIMSLVAVIIYISTSTVGFLSGTQVNAIPIVFSFIAMIALLLTFIFAEKLGKKISGPIIVVSAILLVVSLAVFIAERITLIADVFFIPVNYPEAEGDALYTSIAGFVIYGISIIALSVGSYFKSVRKVDSVNI